jgi:hypothetical protein
MNLNLLLNIDDFRWNDITEDRSDCLDIFGELLETLIDAEDKGWQHPDIYTLTYSWGSVHDIFFIHDYTTVKQLTGGWMKQRHYATFKNLWKFCKDQTEPFCKTLQELNHHPIHKIKYNGIISCSSPNIYFVNSYDKRHELLIFYCSNATSRIKWHINNHAFLPNLTYSNLYLAERCGIELDTDLKERTNQVTQYSKEYCDGGYKDFLSGRTIEAHAEEIGKEIARRNFYKFEAELSRQEQSLRKSLRKIFSLSKNGQNMYLSIDFEKGNCFELCDWKGKHLGEFRFDGLENGKEGSTRDTTGMHDIWALR